MQLVENARRWFESRLLIQRLRGSIPRMSTNKPHEGTQKHELDRRFPFVVHPGPSIVKKGKLVYRIEGQDAMYRLKVKIKSLAEESRIIRKAENHYKRSAKLLRIRQRLDNAGLTNKQIDRLMRRANGKVPGRVEQVWIDQSRDRWFDLQRHRRFVVRPHARAALLAYGYMRGTPYRRMEAKTHEKPNWDTVISNIKKFGEFNESYFDQWKHAS